MNSDKPRRTLFGLTVVELLLALVTLVFGALVTSKNAGMAFADWPTSDGYLMVTYLWLQDFASDWGKFLEHGHRLAALAVGNWSILLVVAAFWTEPRRWVSFFTIGILLGVIAQGLLGGFRVQLDHRGLAMLHGIFAAIVFSLMGTLLLITGEGWRNAAQWATIRPLRTLKLVSTLTVILVLAQYLYGSLVRHKGTGLHEHLGLGFVVLLAIVLNYVVASRSGSRWLKTSAMVMVLIAFSQVGLGLSTWVLKYGFPYTGYVANTDSIHQVLVRTSHMVWGIMTLLACVVNVLKVYRISAVSRGLSANSVVSPTHPQGVNSSPMETNGGVA